MMNKNKFVLGAAAALALSACEGNQERRDVGLEYEYESACGSYASWRSEAMESRHQAIREGRNPNTDFLYENQNGAADRFAVDIDTLEAENPELRDSGLCERAMVRALRNHGRL